jgi:hypothetical protein
MNASIFFKSRCRPIHLDQVERVVLNAFGTTVLPPGIFCANKELERLAFGNSIVLGTRRSTLAPVYV